MAAENPMMMAIRAPQMSRLSTSWPTWLVPSGKLVVSCSMVDTAPESDQGRVVGGHGIEGLVGVDGGDRVAGDDGVEGLLHRLEPDDLEPDVALDLAESRR